VTRAGARRARTAVAVLVSVAFAIAAHVAIVEGLSPAIGALLSLVPVTIIVIALVRRSRRPAVAFAALALVALAAWLVFPSLELHFPDLFFVEHAGGQLLLAAVFGRTLRRGEEPLVARLARIMHGEIPPRVARYCRGVTIAWTIFFCALFVLSFSLFAGGYLAAWSVLANILTPLLVGAMFVIEYLVRMRALPDWERVGLLGGVHAFRRHMGTAPQR
jgi:uncharacterized membrane protein